MSDRPNDGVITQLRSSRSPRPLHPSGSSTDGGQDPWKLDDGIEYDPNKFYVGSRDKDRETVTVAVGIPKSLHGRLEQLIQGQKIPYYKTKQDFIRDAIYHRMYFIKEHENDPAIEQVLATVLAKAAADQRTQEIRDYEETVASLETNMEEALRAEHRDHFEQAISNAESTLESWPACGAKEKLAAVIDRYRRMSSGVSDS